MQSAEAPGAGTTSDGKPYSGDTVSVSGATGAFASSGAGTGILVTITPSLTGTQAGDYTATQPTANANIVDFSLSIAPLTASCTKGNTCSNLYQVTLTPTSGVIAGSVTLACVSVTEYGQRNMH